MPLHQPRRRDESSSSCLGCCIGPSLVSLGQSFRWLARVVKTILHIGFLYFYEKTSLQRNVGSQPSNCHFRPVLDVDFYVPKHFQPCIARGRHGHCRVRKHRISHNGIISDCTMVILTMLTAKMSQFDFLTEEREKLGLNRGRHD